MTDWRKALLASDATIREALSTIDDSGVQVALVISDDRLLEGIVTDGDIRRGLLRGLSLKDPVTVAMNKNPMTMGCWEDRAHALSIMKRRRLHQIPVLDEDGRVVDLQVIDDLLKPKERENPVVIMVGGLGTRLHPLTREVPKPLVEVGGKPILETILKRLREQGFRQFYFSVNYKAEMIEHYFGDGSRWDVSISYLREEERLGTAGSLSLLPKRPQLPFVVMNGDVLTKLDFSHLLDYHERHDSSATMCVRDYNIQVPYGVIKTDEHRIVDIEEKPIQHFYVNAGIYILNSSTLDYVDRAIFLDMPDLFRQLQRKGEPTTVFPLREYWTDIGRVEDLEEANERYDDIFG